MENIKISVVVPVYNAAKYLPRCLDSVLTQDYSNLEIICVNDGSTDESLSVLQVYAQKDERVKVLSQFNQGAAAARNKGIKNATGDYISFIDADDFVAQGLYSYLVQNLQNDLVDIFMFNGVVNNKGGFFSEKNFYHPVAECQNVTCKDFYGIFFGNSGVYNKIFKRSFVEQNKFLFLQGNCFEDIEFWFKSLIAAQAVKVSFKKFYHYCMDNENSVTRTFGANALSLFEMFQAMMKEAQKRGLFAFFNEALLQYQYEKITETLFLMKPEYQERFYQKAKEFLSRRCSQMVGNRYKNLLDFNICYNILINDFIDFKTNISVLTNLCPTHLDYHGNYENYKLAKKNIFNHHTKEDIAIINKGNADSLELTKDIKSTKIYFNDEHNYIKDNYLYINNEQFLDLTKVKIKGKHNYENILAALLVLKQFSIYKEKVIKFLSEFNGVEHRIEYVKTKDGVEYYNDSKSTNPTSTITALKTFNKPIHLILGGLNRNQDFNELNDYIKDVKVIYAIGEVTQIVYKYAIDRKIKCYKCHTLKNAMDKIKDEVKSGEIVLLSPGSSSQDQYQKFEDRGQEFKNLI